MTIIDLFKSIDLFGPGVGIKIKGDDAFKTTTGAITTIMVLGLTTAYFGFLLSVMVVYGNTSISVVVEGN